jgi:hypothetical protein
MSALRKELAKTAEPPRKEPEPAPAPQLSAASLRIADPVRNTNSPVTSIYRISRGPGSPSVQYRLATTATLAEAVGVVTGRLVPPRISLDGRLLGWYRLGNAKGPLPADTRMESVSPEEALFLHFIPSRMLWLTIEIVDPAIRMRSTVATAVPIASLLDGLAVSLDLAAGEWQASLDGVALSHHHILEDRPLLPESRLVIRRA